MARAIHTCAALDRALDPSVLHATTRVQFERPLAAHQDALAATIAGAGVHQVPLVDWVHDLEAMARVRADLAYVVNPHNPTGTAVSVADIGRLARTSRADIVVVDEAYIDFANVESAVPLAAAGELVVLRTLSKLHGLAGARVGYLVGDKTVLDVLRSIRPPFSVNALAQAAATAALRSTRHAEEVRRTTTANRARLADLLSTHGLRPVPSQANFMLVLDVDVNRFLECAARHGVVVRPGDALGVPGAVRITVPDDAGFVLLQDAVVAYASTSDVG